MKKLGAMFLALGCVFALASCDNTKTIVKVSDEAEYTLIQNDTQKAYDLVSGACIGVVATKGISTNTGSAVIYKIDSDRYYAVTNAHVVKDSTSISVYLPENKYNTASILGYDETNDIAVITFTLDILNGSISKELKAVDFMNYENPDIIKVGQTAMVIGCPLGVTNFNILTTGVVSSVSDTQLSTDAAINPGSSGGGMFNLEGRLIGIVREKDVWKYSSSTATAGISKTDTPVEGRGYAIPVDVVKNCITQIEKDPGAVYRPTLGVTIVTVNTILKPQDELKSYVPQDDLYVHFIVTQFTSNSAAKKSGIKSMDVILEIDGIKITTASQIDDVLKLKTLKDKVIVKVYRMNGTEGSSVDVEVSFK